MYSNEDNCIKERHLFSFWKGDRPLGSMHVPMSVVECLLRVYHYHTSIYRLEGKLRVRSFISLLEKNGGFQKMTWEFLWKTFFDFMTSIGRSGVASKRFLYEWHMRNNSNWFLGRRSFVPQTPFFVTIATWLYRNDLNSPKHDTWNCAFLLI